MTFWNFSRCCHCVEIKPVLAKWSSILLSYILYLCLPSLCVFVFFRFTRFSLCSYMVSLSHHDLYCICFFFLCYCPGRGSRNAEKKSGERTWVRTKLLHSCPALWDPVDCSPPGSSVHGILQARILEWVAMSSSRGASRPRNWTHVSYISCTGR